MFWRPSMEIPIKFCIPIYPNVLRRIRLFIRILLCEIPAIKGCVIFINSIIFHSFALFIRFYMIPHTTSSSHFFQCPSGPMVYDEFIHFDEWFRLTQQILVYFMIYFDFFFYLSDSLFSMSLCIFSHMGRLETLFHCFFLWSVNRSQCPCIPVQLSHQSLHVYLFWFKLQICSFSFLD